MKKIQKKKNNYKGVTAIVAIVVIVGLVSIVGANSGSIKDRIVQGVVQMYGQFLIDQDVQEELSFGLSVNTPAFVSHITSNTQVLANFDLTATTTVQEITLGSRYTFPLDFTAGNTSTPGAVGSLTNAGADRRCSKVDLGIFGDLLDDYEFSVTTSTASGGDGRSPTLIASTTRPTSTQGLFNSVDDAGTADMDSWLWKNGVLVEASFGQTVAEGELASSTAYTSTAVGNVYIDCYTQ